jgi:abortive infection bacteriophage resistance protein
MTTGYSRPHLSFKDQVALLKRRNLTITDDQKAEKWLRVVGYQRLKPYWFPFRRTSRITRKLLETFRLGTSLGDAVDLYIADKTLRLIFMDALERIEVAVRVDISHTLGKRDRFAHRSATFLDPSRSKQVAKNSKQTRHRVWLRHADRAERRSKVDWVQEFVGKYGWPLPIWMAVETWDFGTLSHLFELAHPSDRKSIAVQYGVADPEIFLSWLRCLSTVRNICAHHGRLWNEPLVNQPKLPKRNAIPDLSHIQPGSQAHTRLYAAAAIIQFVLKTITPLSHWHYRLENGLAKLARVKGISLSHTGFMAGWKARHLWQ